MKKYILLAVIWGLLPKAQAQQPEPIYSFALTRKSIEWYKEQAQLWKKELDKDPKNAFAWYSYYRVNRNLSRLDTTDSRSMEDKNKALVKIVDDMEKQVPQSYEYNVCRWYLAGNDMKQVNYLKKAEELGPNRTEHLPDMIILSETERDLAARNRYCQRWIKSIHCSPGMMYYNYNVLAGLKKGAILITTGDNDTYPIWALQSMGIRTDVTVINSSLIAIETYQKKLFKELGVTHFDGQRQGLKKYEDSFDAFETDLLKSLAHNAKMLPVYVALTAGCEYPAGVEDSLYLTGLAYEYSTTNMDNLGVLKRNFEQIFALDYLDKIFYQDISQDMVFQINANYIVPMVKLFEHYKTSGEDQKANALKARIMYLVKGRREEKEILKRIG